MYRWHGKQTELGFGSARDVTLARARERAVEARAKLAEGINPKTIKQATAGATFGEVADRLVESMRPSWRSEKSAAAWELTLGKYAITIRRHPVTDLTVEHILEVLKPIWQSKPETAARLRGRIEMVLDAARAQGLRFGENPARWKGNLAHLLSKRQRLARGHHAAMDYADVAGFMRELRARESTAALAFEFSIAGSTREHYYQRPLWPKRR